MNIEETIELIKEICSKLDDSESKFILQDLNSFIGFKNAGFISSMMTEVEISNLLNEAKDILESKGFEEDYNIEKLLKD